MRKIALALVLALAAGVSPARAATVSVADVGSILNQSVALPAEATPGSGAAFDQYFEFTLPTRETVTVSMSDSAIGDERIVGGLLSLNDWTSTGPAPLFIPAGALIESSAIGDTPGGQESTVAPDALKAGAYFAEISGVSGLSSIKIAVDGTATATVVPEPSTWALLALGFGVLSIAAGMRRRARQGEPACRAML